MWVPYKQPGALIKSGKKKDERVEDTMSGKNKIYISEFDMKRLKGLIKFAEERWDKRMVQ